MKDIEGFEGRYAITKDGKVWSYPKDRGVYNGHNGKFLIPNYSNGYGKVGLYPPKNARCRLIHKLVAEAFLPKEKGKDFVDHINGIKTDNRVENLRYVTRSQNGMNRKLNKNNKTGVRGVGKWKSKYGKTVYYAFLKANKKKILSREFSTLEEAVKARREAELKYHGEYSYDSPSKIIDR